VTHWRVTVLVFSHFQKHETNTNSKKMLSKISLLVKTVTRQFNYVLRIYIVGERDTLRGVPIRDLRYICVYVREA